jgi:hydroxypyruvate reductase
MAAQHAALARQVREQGQPLQPPCAILSGGEATVTVKGNGRGGRNTEYALAFALAAQGLAGMSALSAGSDGVDGSADAAGAIVDDQTLAQAHSAGLDLQAYLDDNDSYTALNQLGACIRTGPTGTNINDLRVLLIDR